MARHPHRLRNIPKPVRASSYPSSNHTPSNPFGPQMACDIFGVTVYDDYEATEDLVDAFSSYNGSEDLDEECWYQTEFDFESVREMEQRHLLQIRKFERAYRKMALYALKWHYLMVDLESNAQLDKMFKDIQLMRRLGGSENV